MEKTIYLDNNATTALHPEVKRIMSENLNEYGNASSMHQLGRRAKAKIEESRGIVADFIQADKEEIVFTGGGSESNNTVLRIVSCTCDLCPSCPLSKKELITSKIEHPSILNTAAYLEKHGVSVTYLDVDKYGKINLNQLEDSLSEKTALVSLMMANNEIGTIQDIKKAAELTHAKGALMHTDAVQALGKIELDVKKLGVDFLSLSAHKVHGPKGTGVLYARKEAPFCTFIHGGHQEAGRRAGTLNTLGIVGMGAAVQQLKKEMPANVAKMIKLKEKLKQGLLERIDDIYLNGHPRDVLPGTLNISFAGAEGEAILLYLDLEGIAVSTGSACASGSLDPSHVLLATGLGPEMAHGSIRFSLGRDNSEEEIDYVLEKLPPIMQRIRKMSSVYTSKGKSA